MSMTSEANNHAKPATREAIDRLTSAPSVFKFVAKNFLLRIQKGKLIVVTPMGERLAFGGAETGYQGVLEVRDWRVMRRIASGFSLGFAESFLAGDWDSPNLATLLKMFSDNFDQLHEANQEPPLFTAFNRLVHLLNRNTRTGSRRNISSHYDLGNNFYELWLDPSMTYSSARFACDDEALEDAQRRKYAALADAIHVQEGNHVLEIGCGWGGFAEYAAKERGAHVTGITLSKEQLAYAEEQIYKNQLSEKVKFKLLDYRDVRGRYDGVASVEMFEAVGEEYWPAYFDKIRQVLRPGARAGLQIITIRDDLFETYRRRADFIQRYVFPGGVLPSVQRLREEFERAGLTFEGAQMFSKDYARTLSEWTDRFLDVWVQVLELGFDDRFKRLWRYYLAYCEAGFDTGRINVGQFALQRA